MRSAMAILGALVLSAGATVGGTARAADERMPEGWYATGSHLQDYEIGVDEAVHRGGKGSGTLRSKDSYKEGFATLSQSIKADDYRGKRVRLTGYLKALDVAGNCGFWLRVDGPDVLMLSFDNMMDRPVKGTADWTKCELVLDVPEDSVIIVFGLLIGGRGQAWADDLKLEAVDRDVPVTKESPPREQQEGRREQFKRDHPEEYERGLEKSKKAEATRPKQPVNMDFEGTSKTKG
jgi:hypothetical protein